MDTPALPKTPDPNGPGDPDYIVRYVSVEAVREFEAVPFTVRSFTARAYNRAFRRGGYARRRVNAAL